MRAGQFARRAQSCRGATLVEIMIALALVLVVEGGLVSMYVVSMRSNVVNAANVQLLAAARAKLEQIQAIPYEQVGIRPTGTPAGPGYFVFDPFATPSYNAANGDVLLSDLVTLRDGSAVTRTVTVTAVDDSADGVGPADADGAVDPNTDTILDYKMVTVTATATAGRTAVSQTLSTFIRGSLDVETDGSTGQDSDGTNPGSAKKVKKTKPIVVVTGTDADGCSESAAKKQKKAKPGTTTTSSGC
jgi:hypothetical protein